MSPAIEFYSATPERWPDLERLFAAAIPNAAGNPGGCWCMEWRLPREQWRAQVGAANRLALQALVETGSVPGILAYRGTEAVGWCAVGPRAELVGLREAGHFAAFEAPGVWSIVCLYIAPDLRGQGLMDRLLAAAVEHALQAGASSIEAYPVDPSAPDARERTGFMGSISAFRRAGFVEIAAGGDGLAMTGYTEGNRTMRYVADRREADQPGRSTGRSPRTAGSDGCEAEDSI